MGEDLSLPFEYSLTVPLPSERVAHIVLESLSADEELRPHECVRTMALSTVKHSSAPGAQQASSDAPDSNEVVAHVDVDEQRVLVVNYRTKQLKTLRVAVRGFFDSLDLVLRTVD